MLTLLPRNRVDSVAWDACVAASPRPLLYALSWYLDAVCPAPNWHWMGVVLSGETGDYTAIMPVPLRRKQVCGVTVGWRVHQPFFCQLLGVFSRDSTLDPTPFYQFLCKQFRYGSVLQLANAAEPIFLFDVSRTLSTQVLNLSVGYRRIQAGYSPDRQRNLRRAERAGWVVQDSVDVEPLIHLFQQHHARRISGGVRSDAYDILRNLVHELLTRGRARLRYCLRAGQPEAGALFAYGNDRVIYLFNAASPTARTDHARTLLIDEVIREAAQAPDGPCWFDFESPDKPSIRAFYQGFGPVDESFQSVAWNRLTRTEWWIRALLGGR